MKTTSRHAAFVLGTLVVLGLLYGVQVMASTHTAGEARSYNPKALNRYVHFTYVLADAAGFRIYYSTDTFQDPFIILGLQVKEPGGVTPRSLEVIDRVRLANGVVCGDIEEIPLRSDGNVLKSLKDGPNPSCSGVVDVGGPDGAELSIHAHGNFEVSFATEGVSGEVVYGTVLTYPGGRINVIGLGG